MRAPTEIAGRIAQNEVADRDGKQANERRHEAGKFGRLFHKRRIVCRGEDVNSSQVRGLRNFIKRDRAWQMRGGLLEGLGCLAI